MTLKDMIKIPVATCARKYIDDSLKYNAENASGAGLEVRVTRTYDGVGLSNGRVCQWCMDRECTNVTLAGAYEIGAFQRHDGCGCIIEYTSARGIRTYQAGKSSPDNWLSEREFNRRVNYGLGDRKITPQERIINAAIEMQVRDKNSRTLVDAFVDNHDAFKYYSPEEMLRRLERAGYKVEALNRSQSGFNELSLEDGGGFIIHFGDDGVLQYHPKGGTHKISYWKINNGVRGKHWYDTEGREHFFGKAS